jgi:pseudouridine synthase
VNSVLRRENKYPKVYEVTVDVELTNEHIYQLRNGIIIKTISQHSSSSSNNDKGRDKNTLIARTRPCIVTRIIGHDDNSGSSSKNNRSCRMTLIEGRNRQIRKMMGALGLTVISLRRIEFMGIQLQTATARPSSSSSLKRPGDWAYLNKDEMKLIEDALWTVTEKEK